ncbi:MAG: hypothetical protein WKF83_02890 [Nocardioidaceae bacterium]
MPVVVMGWISLVLVIDADGTLSTQRLLGAATWLLLLVVCARETPLVRAAVVVVVVFATLVEYTFSPLLEVYVYRFDNVPAYVPPVTASSTSRRSPSAVRRGFGHTCAAALAAAASVGAAWASWGLFGSDRVDVLGAFWFACLLGFLLWGPNRGLYVGAFVVVSYLELLGTALGNWEWQRHDPTGLIPIGNPPSGAAGGYGWFDLAAVLLAPVLLALIARGRSVVAPRRPTGSCPAAGWEEADGADTSGPSTSSQPGRSR